MYGLGEVSTVGFMRFMEALQCFSLRVLKEAGAYPLKAVGVWG